MSGPVRLTLINGAIEIRISFTSRDNITVLDTAKELVCKSTKISCYIECSGYNLSKHFTNSETFDLKILDQINTTVDFSISKQNLFSSITFNQLHNIFIRNVH